MTAALAAPPAPTPRPARNPTPVRRAAHPPVRHRVVVRPAPPREPPFDDELAAPVAGRHDRRLPFCAPAARHREPAAALARPHGLPDPQIWGRRLLVGLVECAGGRRPLQQLAGMLSPSIGRGLGEDFERAAVAGRPHWLHQAGVRTVRGAEPAPGVAELCATVECGDRVRAVALRLEAHRGRWRCTRLQLG